MAKDPAFLFYPGDYLRDTQCLSEKTQVAYDRIMCEHMRNICISQEQLTFFAKRLSPDEISELKMMLTAVDGGWQISWVAESICKRRSYSDSRRENRTKKTKTYDNDMKTYDHHMDNENENEVVSDKKREKGKKPKIASESNQDAIEVIAYLNTRSGKNFNATRPQSTKFVNSRLVEGYSVEDLKKIIDCKVKKWGEDDKMRQYIRPETLFAPSKIDAYLQDANDQQITKPSQNGRIRDKF